MNSDTGETPRVENGERVLPTLLRRLNERTVFEYVQRQVQATRAEITRATGISPATVSKAVANLIEAGLLEEGLAELTSGAGRPGILYRLSNEKSQVLGVVLDVRRCTIVGAGLDGQFRPESTISFDTPDSYDELIETVVRHVGQLINRPDIRTLGVGISSPGQIDRRRQVVLFSPNIHILDGKSPARDLQQHLGVPTVMFHETDGTCLAERAYGAAKGLDNFAMIGVYEGFGVSIVCDGRLLEGHDGMAGEVGHITVDLNGKPCGCGNTGCLETVATDTAFAAAVASKLGRDIDIDEVIRLVQVGEVQPDQEINQTLEYLAVGIAAVINIFNPTTVLICSRMFEIDSAIFPRLDDMVRRRALKPLVENCQLIQARGDTRQGAIAGIIQHLTAAVGPLIG